MAEFEHKRADRVAHLLQHELAAMLVDGVKDPRIGFVTVTEVRLTPDLKNARVYVSVYGDSDAQAASLAGLRAAEGYLKRELGRRLRLKYMPELGFCLDDTLERAARVDGLLKAADGGGDADAIAAAQTAPIPVDTHRTMRYSEPPPPDRSRREGRRRSSSARGRHRNKTR